VKRMKQLEGLAYPDRHAVLHIAALKGCLDYLGLDLDYAWLFGGPASRHPYGGKSPWPPLERTHRGYPRV